MRRCAAVLSQWLLIWWFLVTLGFVGLRLAATDGSRDEPQYLSYLWEVVRGDLGSSALDGRSIMAIAAAGLPVDLLLTGGAVLVAWIVGAAWGSLAAGRANDGLGAWLMRLARAFVSVSEVVLVPLCVLFVSAAERWSMVAGGAALWLPMLALAVPYAAHVARVTHRDVGVVLASEPVFAARAMGLPGRRIWARQVLPTAWRFPTSSRLPLVGVFTGVIVIENLLGTAGTGPFFVTAARQQDYAVIMGLAIVYGTLFITAHLAADLVRGWQASSRASDTSRVREAA